MENTNKNAMITCNDHDMTSCNEVLHTFICNDSESKVTRLSKDEWWYLVNTLESWGVFKPRAIVKKNPAAAWKCMNLAKDNYAKSKGAYFTICFKKELAKQEAHDFIKQLEKRIGA